MKQKKMKLLSEINSGFSSILWQVQPGFGELNLVTQQQGLWHPWGDWGSDLGKIRVALN